MDIGRTEALNNLVSSAFSSGNNVMFIFYKNKFNSMRKSCQGKYFAFKAIKLKQTNPKTWWSKEKRLNDTTSAPNEILNQLHIDNTQDLSPRDFADLINNSLMETKRTYNPLDTSNVSTLLDEIE